MRSKLTPPATVVVKVGSSSITNAGGGVDAESIGRIVQQVATVRSRGHDVVLVTSGAVAAGLPALGTQDRPTDIAGLQAAAAVGQGRLMESYTRAFSHHGLVTGQVLLTKDVLGNRQQYINARQTLDRLSELGAVPIVNENDTVVVDELRIGDNDRLAAIVSHMVGAELLVILTDTPGLYGSDPRIDPGAELLAAVRHTDKVLDEIRTAAKAGRFGTGGVATKIAAAQIAAWSGIPTIIAGAHDEGTVVRAVDGETVGTWIEPRDHGLTARKLWIAFGAPSEGRITIDAGATRALSQGGGSLLSVGVLSVDGGFLDGAAVEIADTAGAFVGKGITMRDAVAIAEIAGKATAAGGGPVVHRDDLVVLA
ncbi:Glutamate 5-kinase / RNA-binding C-terminal domain PUA [hydrothermal vent metagenome]|uniref:Glutamate 5-kinase / RNA-binding C-terminal domain PUA n=1 Tax=hydrothermal vent metagenome TaxID=652676 RepID=A0A3B0SPM9_9ZZZZ